MLLLMAMAAPGWAKTKITKQTFEFQGRVRTYYLYVPEETGPMPVVLILHGYPGTDHPSTGYPMVDEWKDLASKEHFIVVAPNAEGSAYWDRKLNPPELFQAVIDQVKAQHPIDTNRIYLFGHSAGAQYALFLGLLDSDYYAAVVVHSGYKAGSPQFPQVLHSTRRIPVAIITGSKDSIYPQVSARMTKDYLESLSFPVLLTILPNDGHDYFPRAGQTNISTWDFMKMTQLTQP